MSASRLASAAAAQLRAARPGTLRTLSTATSATTATLSLSRAAAAYSPRPQTRRHARHAPLARRSYATPATSTTPTPTPTPTGATLPADAAPPVSLTEADVTRLARQRNIGIAAHVDSGKTTLTERVLFYTGRINAIHEVRGRDAVGAKMDHMELEREKGITIQSAATFCKWKATPPTETRTVSGDAAQADTTGSQATKEDFHFNIIDTPGHVDFTIEVERALRVLDGAVLVLCATSGVQSQSITVDRQMRRYSVPRISFINKMDRAGANPWRVIQQIRTKLRMNAAALQIPIGAEDAFAGVVDLVRWKTVWNEGEKGISVREEDGVPSDLEDFAREKRQELIEQLSEVDEPMADIFLEEREPSLDELAAAIRRATLTTRFSPVYMGSAIKNKGVQALLDGVCAYLPNPAEVPVIAIDTSAKAQRASAEAAAESARAAITEGTAGGAPPTEEELEAAAQEAAKKAPPPQLPLAPASAAPFVGLAFKLEEGRFGQLTYVRVYQGTLRKGTTIFNARTGKKVKVPRLVRMHSNDMEDVDELGAGEICAMFGVECSSGDTFTDGTTTLSMSSMFVPEPVISLSITPDGGASSSSSSSGGGGAPAAPAAAAASPNFSRALNRFQKEDPTFRVHIDAESGETIISGMGELHLEIYVERMRREYSVPCRTGRPRVAFRETITTKVPFSYTHKKQTGGAGQFARVAGYIEPMEAGSGDASSSSSSSASSSSYGQDGSDSAADDAAAKGKNKPKDVAFENRVVGGSIPHGYFPACEKGFYDALEKGLLTGHSVTGVRLVLEDGMHHAVDSSELAFRLAVVGAFREAFRKAQPIVMEPKMTVEVVAPVEFQGAVVGGVNQRKGTIEDTEVREDEFTLQAEVSLNDMFGYSSQLRGQTQGKGEFSMEYKMHAPVMPNVQKEMEEAYRKKQLEKNK